MANKVMVVEDEQILAQNLKVYLETLQWDVRLASDGDSAIRLAEEFRPDVIVIDYRLPDMEGFEVLDAISDEWEGRSVLITAHPTSEVYDAAIHHGVGHILFKPFPLGELARAIHNRVGEASGRSGASVLVDRRHNKEVSFPLQLYDGSWVLADRRRSDG
ncbi:response regulator [Zestomonas carbonaria]|uniref:Regulator of RpoS n=1 Tax=Zestomonas carbonaria TaxID=2762745 RepID=A0A7U7ERN4_9GAMM|nr:response regulator [Pseudomonas carbonaria]CAD5108980.1 Regulator of RpoS [Pseudomonas carbonaria]